MICLHTMVEPQVLKELCKAVSLRGMRFFLTNEVVGKGYFNPAFTSASSGSEAWASPLTNGADSRLVS